MLGFGHCPPFIEVILNGDNNSLKIRSLIPHFSANRGSFVWKLTKWTKISSLIGSPFIETPLIEVELYLVLLCEYLLRFC